MLGQHLDLDFPPLPSLNLHLIVIILWTNAGSRAALDSTMALVNQQASALLLQLSVGHARLSGSAEVHYCNSLWNSCLNITAPKVNTGYFLPCKEQSIAAPALLLTTSLRQPVKKTNFTFTPRNKVVIAIREDRKDAGSGMSNFSLLACKNQL